MGKFLDLKNTIELIDQHIDNIDSFIEELTQDDPGFFDPQHDLFKITVYKIKIGMYKEAIKDLEKLNDLFTSCIPSLLMSYCYYKLEDEENHSTSQEKVRLIQQEIVESKVSNEQLISQYLETVVIQAKNFCTNYKMFYPETFWKYSTLVDYLEKGNYDLALHELFSLEKSEDKYINIYILMSHCYLQLKQYFKALETFCMYQESCRASSDGCCNHYIEEEDYQNLLKDNAFFREYAEKVPIRKEKYEFGIQALLAKDYYKAFVEFIGTIAISPDFYYHHLMLGYCYLRLKEYKQADQCYSKAFNLYPTQDYFIKLYEIHNRYNNDQQSYLDDLKQLLDNNEGSIVINIAIGYEFWRLEKYQETVNHVCKMISIVPSFNDQEKLHVNYLLFHSYESLEDLSNAKIALCEILESDLTCLDYFKCSRYYQAKQCSTFFNSKFSLCYDFLAKAYTHQIVKKSQCHLYLHYLHMGYCYYRLKDNLKAIELYSKAYSLNKSFQTIHQLDCIHQLFAETSSNHEEELKVLLSYNPQSVFLNVALGYQLYRDKLWPEKGKYQEVIDHLNNFLSMSDGLDEMDSLHIDYLRFCSSEKLLDEVQASQYLKKILKLELPINKENMDSLQSDPLVMSNENQEILSQNPTFYFYPLMMGSYYFLKADYTKVHDYYSQACKMYFKNYTDKSIKDFFNTVSSFHTQYPYNPIEYWGSG